MGGKRFKTHYFELRQSKKLSTTLTSISPIFATPGNFILTTMSSQLDVAFVLLPI